MCTANWRDASAHRRRARAVGAIVSLGSLVLPGMTPGFAAQSPSVDDLTVPLSSNPAVVATINSERITTADVAAADQEVFANLDSDYQLKRHALELRQQQERHELLEQQLDKLLDRRALEIEATARGVTPDAVLAELKVPPVTEEEARRFYEANKSRTNDSFVALAGRIVEHLKSEHTESATRSFYDGLRAKHGIASLLSPYRLSVAPTGPSRGRDDAPVTVVEFGDFQCPYCREAEVSLRTVMSRYPSEVRLVFRNLPLTKLHPNATVAAEAAVCAGRQGMFWEMHDAMYQDQAALAEDALKETARRLGLKNDVFAACLADPATRQALESDVRAADELNVTGTPYFFINGRPLNGSLPVERFDSLISDELRLRSTAARRD